MTHHETMKSIYVGSLVYLMKYIKLQSNNHPKHPQQPTFSLLSFCLLKTLNLPFNNGDFYIRI